MPEKMMARSSGRITITLKAVEIGEDMLVTITGGKGHIGGTALGTIIGGIATSSVITTPGHRDDRVAKVAAEKLAKILNRNVAVVAGIHYDHITEEEIDEALRLCDELVNELAREWTGR
ncbi:MAG TPA: hypothetical protein VGK13_04205 [Methanocellaceae archaeon]